MATPAERADAARKKTEERHKDNLKGKAQPEPKQEERPTRPSPGQVLFGRGRGKK